MICSRCGHEIVGEAVDVRISTTFPALAAMFGEPQTSRRDVMCEPCAPEAGQEIWGRFDAPAPAPEE